MSLTNLLIIADDLSGAADCAVAFAAKGRRTVVVLDGEGIEPGEPQHGEVAKRGELAPGARFSSETDVIAADIDTRRLTAEMAGQRAQAIYRTLGGATRRLCKKIDSTLRGNWAAEVAALQPLAGLAIVAPAFPATGRIVVNAEVLVHGIPLEQTETWQLEHADSPANLSLMLANVGLRTAQIDVATLRSDALLATLQAALSDGVQAVIVDAHSSDDLNRLVRVTCNWREPHFWVGSGGLARELASLPDTAGLFAAPIATADARSESIPSGATLALVGSLSAVSEQQCKMLRDRAGMPEWTVPPVVLRQEAAHPEWADWQARIATHLNASQDLLLRIGRDASFDPAEGAVLSAGLARLVAPSFGVLGGIILTGGETARAMLVKVGVGWLELIDEVEAGVAVSRPASPYSARPGIVTKAGAFGTEHALYGAYLYLEIMKMAGAVGHLATSSTLKEEDLS